MESTCPRIHDKVYIRDERFEWLPATVVHVDDQQDRVLVQLDLPSNWESTTILPENASNYQHDSLMHEKNQQHQLWVQRNDYHNHQLPVRLTTHDHEQGLTVVRDLADLPHLHEAAMLYQLKERHAQRKPYTSVGDKIIVAVNPGQWIPHLYSSNMQQAYARSLIWQVAAENDESSTPSSSIEEKKDDDPLRVAVSAASSASNSSHEEGLEPHVYKVSALAYRSLALDRQDQSILVSGESGSGKTETVKLVVQHLARLSEWRPNCDGYAPSSPHLVLQIDQAFHILQALGNAKTSRNHNSSRFGKVTKLNFSVDETNHVCLLHGQTTDTFFLETSRVVSLAAAASFHERNFHIFYQLLAAPEDTKVELLGEKWRGATGSDFRYLQTSAVASSNNLYQPPHSSDRDLWDVTERALRFFGWKDQKLKTMIQALGVILRLGNIVFDETVNSREATISSNSRENLDLLAQALGFSMLDLALALTRRGIKTAQEEIDVPCSADQAKEACDRLAKILYERIFSAVVSEINSQTAVHGIHESTCNTISLIDIFGFECFETNRFQQLCVNYTNEKLQHMYVDGIMEKAKREYQKEGIELGNYKTLDNSSTIELFEGPNGLIRALENECILPDGNNEDFVFKIKRAHNKTLYANDSLRRAEFGIKHFACPVIYDARNFVEENDKKLPCYLLQLVSGSSNELIRTGVEGLLRDEEMSKVVTEEQTSILEKFRVHLNYLIAAMNGSHVRYIRCIRPNDNLQAKKMDHAIAMRQFRSAGLVAAVEVTRKIYPKKLTFSAVEERFQCLMSKCLLKSTVDMPLHDRINFLMSMLFAPFVEQYRGSNFSMPYACGNTNVYFRAGSLEYLEAVLSECYSNKAKKIQQWSTKSVAQRKYRKFLSSVVRLQSLSRRAACRSEYQRQRSVVVLLQAYHRGKKDRSAYAALRIGVRSVQAMERNEQEGSVCLQAWYRSLKNRMAYQTKRISAIKLQAWYRSEVEAKRYSHKLHAHTVIGSSRLETERFHKIGWAVVILQTRWRTRFRKLTRVVVTIQIRWRKRFHIIRRAVVALQTRWRHRSRNTRRAVVTLQTRWRTRDERRKLQEASNIVPGASSVTHSYTTETADMDELFGNCDASFSSDRFGDELSIILEADCPYGSIQGSSLGSVSASHDIREPEFLYRQSVSDLKGGSESSNGASILASSDGVSETLSLQQRLIKKLKEEIVHVATEAEMHTQEVVAEFEERLAEYEYEVLDLRQTVQQCEYEKEELQKELQLSRDNYAKTIKRLQQSIRESSDSHKEYLSRISSVLDGVNESRKAETSRFADEIETMQREALKRDSEVRCLQDEINKLKAEKMEQLRVSREEVPKQVHRLARKLEHLFSSNQILSVLEKARRRPDLAVSLFEASISSKCRKILYRLEDVVSSYVGDGTKRSESKKRKETMVDQSGVEVISLQNQLVRAYEKIEYLQHELEESRSDQREHRNKVVMRHF